jgi:hypothetical protein
MFNTITPKFGMVHDRIVSYKKSEDWVKHSEKFTILADKVADKGKPVSGIRMHIKDQHLAQRPGYQKIGDFSGQNITELDNGNYEVTVDIYNYVGEKRLRGMTKEQLNTRNS